jgi:polyhydroxyalkanoate synthase
MIVTRLPGAARSLARHGLHFAGETASVVTGGSPIAPARGDRRFKDPAFTDTRSTGG